MTKSAVNSCIWVTDLDITNVLDFIIILRRNTKPICPHLASHDTNILSIVWTSNKLAQCEGVVDRQAFCYKDNCFTMAHVDCMPPSTPDYEHMSTE